EVEPGDAHESAELVPGHAVAREVDGSDETDHAEHGQAVEEQLRVAQGARRGRNGKNLRRDHRIIGSSYSPNSARRTSAISPSVQYACAASTKRASRLSLERQASRTASSAAFAFFASRFFRSSARRRCWSRSTSGSMRRISI